MNADETSGDGMTDRDLDRILAEANAELLGHIETATDAAVTLAAIMARPQISYHPGRPSPAGEAAIILAERSLAYRIDRALARAGSLGSALSDADARRRATAEARSRNRARRFARAFDRAVAFGWTASRAWAIMRAREDAVALASDLARARALACAVGFALDGRLTENLAEITQILEHETDLADHGADLDRACARADDLKHSLDRQRTLVPRFEAIEEVDASGVDLSALDLPDMSVLEGVVWTDETAWPPGVHEQVIPLSEEIDLGVYKVRSDGSDREPSVLVEQ